MDIVNAAGYIRVSTEEQALKGLSLESQEALISDYCKRQGFKLVGLYIDKGITARKKLSNRKEFLRMCEDIKAHKINHVVILRLDRFFRNVYDYHKMMNEVLTPNGCEWSSVQEDYDTTTTNGRLMINLRLAIAEQECDQDSDRIKDVFGNRIKQGYVVSGSQPYGYKIVDKRPVIDEEKAEIVKTVFNEFIATNSLRRTMLNMESKYGIHFSYNSISRMLAKRQYTGMYRDVKDYYPAIISEEIFNKVQLLAKRNVRVNTGRIFIFSGIVKCACCGGSYGGVMGSSNHLYKYYRCTRQTAHTFCTNSKRKSEKQIESYLLENARDLMSEYVVRLEAKQKEKKQQKSNRKQIEKKIDRLKELYINDMISMDEYKHDREALEAQIIDETYQEEKKKNMDAINEFLKSDFEKIYNDLTDQEKQCLWRSVIDKIYLNEKNEITDVIFLT